MTRSVVRTLVAAIAVASVVLLVIVAVGWSPRVEYVLAIAVTIGLGVAAVRRLMASVAPPAWPSPTGRRPVPSGVDPRIGVIESTVRKGTQDAGVCRRRLQPLLVELAIHRLSRHRGVGLVEDPAAARRMLGDESFGFLTEVVEDAPSEAELARIVTSLERL